MTSTDGYNLLAPVFAAAERHPSRLALTTTRESATYRQLRDFVISFAHHMRAHGLNRQTRIAIADGHPMINTILAMACALVGCSWVRAFPHALANPALRLTHCLHAGPLPPGLRIQSIAVPASWSRPPRGATGGMAAFECHPDGQATWMIAQSSGTTGTPKYMAVEAGSIWRRGLGNFCSVPAEIPVFTSMFPALSTLNIVPALHTFSLGGTFVFGHLADIQGRIHIDAILGSPSHFVGYMHERRAGPDRLGTAIVTGSAAGPAFFTRMASYFETVTFAYGSTETSAVTATQVAAPPPGTAAGGAIDVGPAFPGVDIQIVDEAGTPVPQGNEGRVRVRAPCQVAGYIGESALSAEVFAGGWFHPGDLGYLDTQGHLHISGRVNDRMNIGGRKLDPAMVDAVLQGLPDIRDGVCFALPTPAGIDVLAAAVVPSQPRDAAGIAQDLAVAGRSLPPGQAPDVLFVLAAIPRNPNGKVLRHAVPDAVRGLMPTPVPRPFGDDP